MTEVNPIANFMTSLTCPQKAFYSKGTKFEYWQATGGEQFVGQSDSGNMYAAERTRITGMGCFFKEIDQLCALSLKRPDDENISKRLESLKSFLVSVKESSQPLINVFKKHTQNFQNLINELKLEEFFKGYEYSSSWKLKYLANFIQTFSENFKSIVDPKRGLKLNPLGPETNTTLLHQVQGQAIFYGYNDPYYGNYWKGLLFSDPPNAAGLQAIAGGNFYDHEYPGTTQVSLQDTAKQLDKFDFATSYSSLISPNLRKENRAAIAENDAVYMLLDYFRYAKQFIENFELIPLMEQRLAETIESRSKVLKLA